MTVALTPTPRQLFLNPTTGAPASGFKVFTYFAGTTSKADTFTDATGNTENVNPIILDSLGECDLWLSLGVGYKIVFAPPTDTDPPTHAIWTRDNISAGDAIGNNAETMADMRAMVQSAATVGTIIVLEGWYEPGDGGGGLFLVTDVSPGADNNGTFIDSDTPGFYLTRIFTGPVYDTWFGALGDCEVFSSGTTSALSTTLHCTARPFTTADIGKTLVLMAAGPKTTNVTTYGGRAETLITTVASISGTNAIMANAATQALSGVCVFAIGTPDDTAIDNMLGTGMAARFVKPGYLRVTQHQVGNSIAGWSHDIRGENGTGSVLIAFGIPNHTDDCVKVIGYEGGSIGNNQIFFTPIVEENFSYWCLGTGLDGWGCLAEERSIHTNINVWYTYRNRFAFKPGTTNSNNWITLNTYIQFGGPHAGLHAFYFALLVNNAFIGANTFLNVNAVAAWSENAGAFGIDAATQRRQLGCAIYSLNRSTDGNSINGNVFDGKFYADDGRGVAVGNGTDINPVMIFWEDGAQNLVIEGAGVGGSANIYQYWTFENVETDDTTNAGNISGSSIFEIGSSVVNNDGLKVPQSVRGGTYVAIVGTNTGLRPLGASFFEGDNWPTATPPFNLPAATAFPVWSFQGRIQNTSQISGNNGSLSSAKEGSNYGQPNITYNVAAQNITIPLLQFPNLALAAAYTNDTIFYDVSLMLASVAGTPPADAQLSCYRFGMHVVAAGGVSVPTAVQLDTSAQTYFVVNSFAVGGTQAAPTMVVNITTQAAWNGAFGVTPTPLCVLVEAIGGRIQGQ